MAEIGSIGIGTVRSVTVSGQISFLHGGSVLHWGVRADDRWHIARGERTIRQGVAGDGVSIETRLRVPGGDIVHRTSSTPYKNSSLVVVEVENETPVPIALALFIDETAAWECNGGVLSRDQIPFLRADKPIADMWVASSEADLLQLVKEEKNRAGEERINPREGSHVAVIFPLPHTTTLRFVVRTEPNHNLLPSPDNIPSLEGIANGWNVHLDQGVSVEIRNGRLQDAVLSARRHLLVGSGQAPTSDYWQLGVPKHTAALASVALCAWGHDEAGKHLLLQLLHDQPLSTFQRRDLEEICYLLWASNEFLRIQEVDEVTELVSDWAIDQIGNLIESIPRWRMRRHREFSFLHLGLESSVSLLKSADRGKEAQQLKAALPSVYKRNFASLHQDSLPSALLDKEQSSRPLLRYLNVYAGGRQGFGNFDESMSVAEKTGIFSSEERLQDPLASAVFLLAFRRALLGQPTSDAPTVALFPDYDPHWFNIPVEVKNIPTRNGKIGYAIRWHGNRPALLWAGDSRSDVIFIAPGLDESWKSFESQGEALFPQQEPHETALPFISPVIQRNQNRPTKSDSGETFS